jgi:hypothetical protein
MIINIVLKLQAKYEQLKYINSECLQAYSNIVNGIFGCLIIVEHFFVISSFVKYLYNKYN